MPNFRGVTVNIVTEDDKPFGEYGVKYMPTLNECSCYIQSDTNVAFKVQLKEDSPFLWELDEGKDDVAARPTHRFSPRTPSPLASRFAQSGGGTARAFAGTRNRAEASSRPPSITPSRLRDSVPPFHFLVCVYLDGRVKSERRTILYLDPENRYYKTKPTQLVSRWVQDSTGDIRSHKWVFKDVVGIENMLDKLFLTSDFPLQGTLSGKQSDELVAAMTAATLKCEERQGPHPSAGSIRVTLERVTIGVIKDDHDYQSSHRSWDQDDVKMGDADGHVAGPSEKGELVPGLRNEPVKIIEYLPYVPGERLYAQYTFYYRSKDVLRKFDFPEFAQERKERSNVANQRYMNDRFATLTPLGISNPVKTKPWSSKISENRKAKHGITLNILSASSSPHAKSKVSKPANRKGASEVKGASSKTSLWDNRFDGWGYKIPAFPSGTDAMKNESESEPGSDSDSDDETENAQQSRTRMDMPVSFVSKEFKFDPNAFQTTSNRVLNLKNTAASKNRSLGFHYTPSSDADVDEDDVEEIEELETAQGPRSAFYIDKRPQELREDYDATRTEFHGMAENRNDGGISEQLVSVALSRKRILDDSGSDSEDANSERLIKRARGSVSPRDEGFSAHQKSSNKSPLTPIFPPPAGNTHLQARQPGLDESSMSDLSGYNGDTEREVETDSKPEFGLAETVGDHVENEEQTTVYED